MNVLWAIIIVSGIGLIAGIGLCVASALMSVPVDSKQKDIRDCLPGANCGACGFAGCDDYAAAICQGKSPANLCVPGGDKTAKALSGILGAEINTQQYVAFVACGGDCEKTQTKNLYQGLQSCAAASMLYGGPSACSFGCIGLGDCVSVCDKGAISVLNGTAKVFDEFCVGCRKCESVCPKKIINMIPKSIAKQVACSNKDKGAAAKKVCAAACIGCKLCQKQCEFGAISVNDNLAQINPELCNACGKCVEKCPQKCII